MFEHYRKETELRRLVAAKGARPAESPLLGSEVVHFFKQSVQKRQTKFGRIAKVWEQVIPPALAEHCALESLHRGSLTVIVDSSAHIYELKQLLLAGLEQQIKRACPSADLKKICIKPGRWYEQSREGATYVRF
jgi:hypothetical protein